MSELVFVKLGGSLLTDKTLPASTRPDVMQRLASEIAAALAARPDLQLVVGHGSGSFGHVAAQKYGTALGVRSPDGWRGYAETSVAAGRLNRWVVDVLWDAGVPVLPLQPSASARCEGGELMALDERPLVTGLAHGLAPVVYGDVALDDRLGGTVISTERIFRWLAARLAPRRILLVGEVQGVLSADPGSGQAGDLIPVITPASLAQWEPALGASRGVDVTGGMLDKVRQMLGLVRETPTLEAVQIISGLQPGLVRTALADPGCRAGTVIRR